MDSLYFAREPGGAIKIGVAHAPKWRVRELRFRGRVARATLLGVVEFSDSDNELSPRQTERALLEANVAYWIDGEAEWFYPTPSIAALVRVAVGVTIETTASYERCLDQTEALRRIRRQRLTQRAA